MRNGTTRFRVKLAIRHRLHHVQVVQDVVQAAVVWQPVQEGANGFFRGHWKVLLSIAPSWQNLTVSVWLTLNQQQRAASAAVAHHRASRRRLQAELGDLLSVI
jgi:hypothetical protein